MPKTTCIVLAVLTAFLACNSQPARAEDSPARLEAPKPAEQAAVLKVIHELFKNEYGKRAPAGRAALAARLMKAAAESAKDPLSQYVLLREARDNAIAGGDADTALAAVDALTSRFKVDPPALRVETLTALERQSQSPELALAVTNAAMAAIEKAAAANHFDMLARLSPVAEGAAAKTHFPLLEKHVQARLRELKESSEAFESAEGARRLLSKKPDDPEANTILGKYLWLQKNDWASAMPHLAKGSDAALKTLAMADLSAPQSADAKTTSARGDAWWQYAGTQPDLTKIPAHRRAADWYHQASPALSGLEKLVADKRIRQADADSKASASAHGMGSVVDPALAQYRRDSIERAPTHPLDAQTLKGDVTIPPSVMPYAISGTIKITEPTTITVPGGTEIRGGVLDLGGKGQLVATGETGKPAIFRHVAFIQDLGSSLKADGAVFDDCKFNKGGAWFSNYSSKWIFTSCVLHNCRFGGLTEVDYGFQIRNCVLVSMDFPEIQHPHKPDFDHVTALHQEWNTMTGCTFVDCTVPPTVCWCAESSNFFGCKFISGEPFDSAKPWQKTAYVSNPLGPAPQTVWADDMPKRASVSLLNAPAPFPTLPLAGLDTVIPELVIRDSGVAVIKSHLK